MIDNLFLKPIDTCELELAKEQIKTELIIDTESTHNHMESNGKALIYGETVVSVDEILKNIEAITPEAINDFLTRYIKNKRPSACLVGDMSQLNMAEIQSLLESFSV